MNDKTGLEHLELAINRAGLDSKSTSEVSDAIAKIEFDIDVIKIKLDDANYLLDVILN